MLFFIGFICSIAPFFQYEVIYNSYTISNLIAICGLFITYVVVAFPQIKAIILAKKNQNDFRKPKLKKIFLIIILLLTIFFYLLAVINIIHSSNAFMKYYNDCIEYYQKKLQEPDIQHSTQIMYEMDLSISTSDKQELILTTIKSVSILTFMFGACLWLIIEQIIKVFHRARPVQAE